MIKELNRNQDGKSVVACTSISLIEKCFKSFREKGNLESTS